MEVSSSLSASAPARLLSSSSFSSLRSLSIALRNSLAVRAHPLIFPSSSIKMDSQPPLITTRATPIQNNHSALTSPPSPSEKTRVGEVKRLTKETNAFVKKNLDGSGIADSTTGIPFLDHILDLKRVSVTVLMFCHHYTSLSWPYLVLWRRWHSQTRKSEMQ